MEGASSGPTLHEAQEVAPLALFHSPVSSSPSKASKDVKPPTIKLKLAQRKAKPPSPEAKQDAKPDAKPATNPSKSSKPQPSNKPRPQRARKPASKPLSKSAGAGPGSATAGASSAKKRVQKKIVTFKYFNVAPLPQFTLVALNGDSPDLFWLRLNLREFLLRFDKLVRLPTKHAAAINDPLNPWSEHLYKAVIVSLFRVLQNDETPLYAQTKDYLQDIEHTAAESSQLWVHVQEFLEEVDPYVEAAVSKLNGEQYRLELIRRLIVLSTGTETIRVTVMNDNEQLRHIQQDAVNDVRQLTTQWKATEKKLAHLKTIDEATWKAKVDAAKYTSEQRILKVRQTVFLQLHKYNLRTAPLGTDIWGNTYWSLQFKSKEFPAWGSWILCDLAKSPQAFDTWRKAFLKDVDNVIASRSVPRDESNKGKRYPKLKIKPVVDLPAGSPDRLFYVSGKENIAKLANWIASQASKHSPNRPRLASLSSEIAQIASYVALDDN